MKDFDILAQEPGSKAFYPPLDEIHNLEFKGALLKIDRQLTECKGFILQYRDCQNI